MCYLYGQKGLIWIRKLCNIQRNIWIMLVSMPDFIKAVKVTSSVLNHCWLNLTGRPNGLGVWFLLWVQEVPGSNPGLALDFSFFFFFWMQGCNVLNQKKFHLRGHSELNQGPAGLQPDALPLSYIPVCGETSKQLWSILALRFDGDTSLSGRVAVAEN
jgi:hypothetical protein